MAVLDHTKTLSNLLKKGFKESTTKSDDHIRVEFWHNNQLTRAKTKLSRNKQDIGDKLISLMAKQVYLPRKKFMDLAKCPLSQSEYEKILKDRGFI